MFAAVLILFSFLNKISPKSHLINLFFMFVMFACSSFFQIHMSCIYAERMMLFLLATFMFFYWKGENLQSTGSYVLAFLAAAYTTYIKEPCFGMIAVIPMTNFIFRYGTLSKKDRKFNLALLGNSAIYLSIYIYRHLVKRPPKEGMYEGGWKAFSFHGVNETIDGISAEPIMWLALVVFLLRAGYVLFKKDRRYIFLDGLLFAAVAYVVAILGINMNSAYRIFPSVVLALPSLAHWTVYLWREKRWVSVLMMVISIFLAKNSAMTSKLQVIETWELRKTDMPIIHELVRQYSNGVKLIWLSKHRDLNSVKVIPVGKKWRFMVYDGFISYHLGEQVCVLELRNNPDNIPPNSIVLCQTGRRYEDAGFSIRIKRIQNFRHVAGAFGVKIYVHKSIQWRK
jgi:hypothetical protein